MKTQFKTVGKNDIETTIVCVDCGTKKIVIVESDVIRVLNEFCHGCQKEGVLII